MKNIVIFDEFNEIDLKPADLLQRYIQLSEKDVNAFLIKDRRLKECSCPACRSQESRPAFKKFGLQYLECIPCHSLYICPRPDDGDVNRFYTSSESRAFWRDELFKMTIKKRKEKIIKPRFQWILDSTEEYLPTAQYFADINTNQYGYIEEILQNTFFKRKILINPLLKLDKAKFNSGMMIVDTPWWDAKLKKQVDVISLFEVIDRTANIEALFTKVRDLLKKDGLLFMTAILISGFDLQTLWEKAENLYPPDRMNVLSIEGLEILFRRHNFECLELSTPGILDVEIVDKALKHHPDMEIARFTKYLLENRDERIKKSFQEFLQSNLLSSYGRILARKK